MTGKEVWLRTRPIVLGIAGCSGSGKTTLAAELARALDGVHFPLDHYYRDLSHLSPEERAEQNFDDPALIEDALLAEHVAALARGDAIERPVYDFATHTRVTGRTETIQPASYVVVEGLFALLYADLLPLYGLKVFVETPDDVCFARRVRRDVEERGRTRDSVQAQYAATVKPAAVRDVLPSASQADLVVTGTGALDWMVEQVVHALRGRGLVRATGSAADQ